MWTVVGSFDAESDDLNFRKHKVLKAGKTYGIGRKGQPLIVNHKRISHDHSALIVGDYTLDNASDPSFIPTLSFVNIFKPKGKGINITRGQDKTGAPNGATVELQDGDELQLVTKINITVNWVPLCCFVASPKPAIPLEVLASLAVSVVYAYHPNVTHHVVDTITATPSLAASLLSTINIVRPDFLAEVIRIGALPSEDPKSWEFNYPHNFTATKKYLPPFDEALDKGFRQPDIWYGDESRLHLFKDYRFLCVGEKSREINSDLRAMIERGEGAIETFNVQDGVLKWRKSLSRGAAKEDVRVVAVADSNAMISAVGKDAWAKLVQEAEEFQVDFVSTKELVDIVLNADAAPLKAKSSGRLDASQSQSLVTPIEESIIPLVVDDPPPPTTRRKPPTRRAPSRQPSQAPDVSMMNPENINSEQAGPSTSSAQPIEATSMSVDSLDDPAPTRRKLKRRLITQEDKEELGILESTQPEPARKPLTRRGQGGLPVITGLDDNSVLLDASPDLGGPPPETETQSESMPAPRSKRLLKRRRETVDETLDSQFASLVPKEEPAYKKHKALFESLDPDNMSFDGTNYGGVESAGTQSEAGVDAVPLRTVYEEEEETQTQTQSRAPPSLPQRGQKRKASEDVEMDGVEAALQPRSMTQSSGEAPPSKKRALENVNAVERLPTTVVHDGQMRPPPPPPPATIKASKSAKGGADPGKPDTDAAFLKAIASTKRGKKQEDEFDREFNKLKISKPDLERENVQEAWKVLDDFGEDANIRGNFMVVVPMEVFRKERERAPMEVNEAWSGQANFKKFKKKGVERTRATPVALVISDYSTMRENSEFPSAQSRDFDSRSARQTPEAKIVPKAEPDVTRTLFDSDDEDAPPAPAKVKPTRGRKTPAPTIKISQTQTQRKSRAASALFLEGSDDEKDELEEDDDDAQTLRSRSTAPPPRRAPTRSRRPAIVENDDSDEEEEEIVAPVRATRR